VDEYDHAANDMLLPFVGFLFNGESRCPKVKGRLARSQTAGYGTPLE
jgi:hypothetical protein